MDVMEKKDFQYVENFVCIELNAEDEKEKPK
jgi:hypothetical protein